MVESATTRAEILQKFDLFRGGTGGLDNWLGEEAPDQIFATLGAIESVPLSRARFDQLLTLAHEAPLSEDLFRFYWLTVPDKHPYNVRKLPCFNDNWGKSTHIASLDHLFWGLYRFYIDALLYFGNIRTAFQRLRQLSSTELNNFFLKRLVDTDSLSSRGDPIGLGSIAKDNRYLISEMACKSFERTTSSEGELATVLIQLFQEHVRAGGGAVKVKDLLEGAYEKGEFVERQLQFTLSADEFLEEIVTQETDLRQRIDRVSTAFDRARSVALANTEAYLSMVGDLDTYVATSMRSRDDFRFMADFCDQIFSHADLQSFRLRHFDPTLSAADHHEDKGLIECLMVKCTKVLILYAGRGDSYGKDAEAAMALSLGKPVIIYADQEYRSRFFRDIHPLSRLIDFNTGVAIGAMVATCPEEVVELLRRIFSNELEYELAQTYPGYLVLKEKTTGSVVRLQTSNALLRETFWNHYHNDVS